MTVQLPHWSPDGQQIAFMGETPGKNYKIFLISREGGPVQGITTDQLAEGDPAWSADGKALAFTRAGSAWDESSHIEVLNTQTRQTSQLPGSNKVCCPRWSPDGRYIIALTSPVQRLILYDVKNDKWKPFDTKQAFNGSFLAWSHDSAYVYLDCEVGGESRYCRLRIGDGKLEPLFDFKKLSRRFPGLWGGVAWLGLGPGDTPLFVRDISTQEIYALDVELP
jgi:Tol biopolymer transport system component